MSLVHLLVLLCVIASWGFNFVAIKAGLQELPPIFLCFARFLFSSIPAVFFIKRPPVPLKMILLYSFIMFVLQFSLLFSAMHSGITAALASILLQIQSFFAMLFAILFLGEKYHLRQAAGFGVALLGILLVAMHIGKDVTATGLSLVLGAAFTWASGSFIAKKLGKGSGFGLVVWSSLFASPPLLLLSYLLEGSEWIGSSIEQMSWISIASVSYTAYLSTLFGFGVWNQLLYRYPLSKLAPFTLLVPIVGIFSSVIFLDESLQWWKIAAAMLILGGLCIHLFGPKADPLPEKSQDASIN